MKISKWLLLSGFNILLYTVPIYAQSIRLKAEAENAMLRATKFMVEDVSYKGGYVWYYTTDLSRRWGEMEAYKSMIWVQDGGTVNMGHTLLDAYRATHNEYFYQAAEKAANALVWGQSAEGGWNYMIDFAGDRSLKNWYNTIGKNGWRLEEFQHYYGNDTFDDDVSSNAARFLLRIYLEKLDPKYKPALEKAISFILKSQYPNGGWPQRYPHKHDFNKAGHPDYSSFYTFNDDVIWENVNFLIQCYETLGEERFLKPIYKGMDFFLLSQQKNGAWGQQYNMKMEPAGGRTYEPPSYLPRATFKNCMLLLKFYQYTGDKKYIATIPKAVDWLEKVKLPANMTDGGVFTHSLFVELGTDMPIFVHRKGSNVTYGYYYVDYNDASLLSHMHGKSRLNIQELKDEYQKVKSTPSSELTKSSPLLPAKQAGDPIDQLNSLNQEEAGSEIHEEQVKSIISQLDSSNRWLVAHASISNPYIGDGTSKEPTTKYSGTNVGDLSDTSPFRDPSDTKYISTPEYIKNMNSLIRYLKSLKGDSRRQISEDEVRHVSN